MDPLIFHFDADKADTQLLDSIKAHFGNRRVQVIVTADETTDDLIARHAAEQPDYALPFDDIARLAAALDRNETIDVMAEVKKFMDTK